MVPYWGSGQWASIPPDRHLFSDVPRVIRLSEPVAAGPWRHGRCPP